MSINLTEIIDTLNDIRCSAADELGDNLDKAELISRCNYTYDKANALLQKLIKLQSQYIVECESLTPKYVNLLR